MLNAAAVMVGQEMRRLSGGKGFCMSYRAKIALMCSVIAFAMIGAAAHAEVSFRDKTITMIVSSAPGGGTDVSGRAIARFLSKYLPGEPNVIVQNMPGANGVTALNHFVNQTAPDGLTVVMAANAALDPMVYGTANVKYDTKAIRMVGGVGRGGSVLFMTKESEPRLHDKSASPVNIGSIGPTPRPGIQPALWAIEYLGWNAKWIKGYPGTDQVMVALDRGEVDLTATSNIFLIKGRIDSGKVSVLFQTGTISDNKVVGRSDFGDMPIFINLMKGKITDPIAQKAFDYWIALSGVDKCLGLPPKTSDDIVAAYREAFKKMSTDKEFLDLGDKISDGFDPVYAEDVEGFVKTLADTPPEALGYMADMMRKQGWRVQ
jgi:hypothetical protein